MTAPPNPFHLHADLSALAGGPCNDMVVDAQGRAFACMLGGADKRTLFVVTNVGSGPAIAEKKAGRIETVQVDVPGAGLP